MKGKAFSLDLEAAHVDVFVQCCVARLYQPFTAYQSPVHSFLATTISAKSLESMVKNASWQGERQDGEHQREGVTRNFRI